LSERIERLVGRLELSSNDRGTTSTTVRVSLPLEEEIR
jgi:hypothetical protein